MITIMATMITKMEMVAAMIKAMVETDVKC